MTVSKSLLTANAITVALLSLGASCPKGTPPQPRKTGTISITAGYGATRGEACTSNSSGVVQFTVIPQNLTGTDGITTRQPAPGQPAATGQLPQFASEVGRDIESNLPNYGCQASRTFSNLAFGTWQVQVSGAAGAGTCTTTISPTNLDAKVTIWQGVCR